MVKIPDVNANSSCHAKASMLVLRLLLSNCSKGHSSSRECVIVLASDFTEA